MLSINLFIATLTTELMEKNIWMGNCTYVMTNGMLSWNTARSFLCFARFFFRCLQLLRNLKHCLFAFFCWMRVMRKIRRWVIVSMLCILKEFRILHITLYVFIILQVHESEQWIGVEIEVFIHPRVLEEFLSQFRKRISEEIRR